MRRGDLLSPDAVHQGQRVIVVPTGADVSRGVGLGCHAECGTEQAMTDAVFNAARRGSVLLFALPKPEPAAPAPPAEAAPAPAAEAAPAPAPAPTPTPGEEQYPMDQNPNVSPQVKTPDTYLYISTQPVSTGTAQPKDLFLLAPEISSASPITGSPYNLTAGTADLNSITQETSVAAVNSRYHRRSLAANRFRDALQAQPVGLNLFVPAIADPTGSNFAGFATQFLGFEGTVAGAGEVKVRICGFLHRIPVANGDTAATVGQTALTALGGVGGGTNPQQPDCPMIPGALLTDKPVSGQTTLPLVFVHRGEVGNEHPITVEIPPEVTGLKVCVAICTITTNAAGAAAAASLYTLRCGSLSITVSIAIGTTPTQAATAIAAAINAATFPLTATSAAGVLKLYYRGGWVVQRIQCNSTEDAGGQVYTLTDRLNDTHADVGTAATTAGSATYTGLQGSGTPTLTTVLSNKAKMNRAMLEWFCEYLDSTTLGAIYAHIEQRANGYFQEGQRVTFASGEVLDASGTGLKNAKQRLTDPSPALTNSWRYELLVYQDGTSSAGAAGAQLAADLAATALPYNFDGHKFTPGTQPLLPGRSDTELDPNTADTAMRSYFVTPLRGVNGQLVVIRGVTSWAASNTEWADYSYGRMFDDLRFRLRAFLNQRFNGKVLFTATSPRVENAFTLTDVENAVREVLNDRDGITVDGAKDLGRYVKAEVDPDDGTYIRIALRNRPPREAHVKSGVISSAPAAA